MDRTLRGMHAGDHTRKESLVDYGFRMPSAYDNRPLNFDEFDPAEYPDNDIIQDLPF